jgi:hypothetical protein
VSKPPSSTGAAVPSATVTGRFTCASFRPFLRIVPVRDAPQLHAALAAAQPGDCIQLFAGLYQAAAKVGFVLQNSGTAGQRIALIGPADAVLSTADSSSTTALHFNGADNWDVVGFRVTHGQRGIVMEGANNNLLRALSIVSHDREGIWIKSQSSNNMLHELEIRATGTAKPSYGAAIVLGSPAFSSVTAQQDASLSNHVIACRIGPDVAGESITIHPFTMGGIIAHNVFDARGQSGRNLADSFLNLQGNGYYVFNNTGVLPIKDAFQVYSTVEGWGSYNTFDANAVLLQDAKATGLLVARRTINIWKCNNFVRGGGTVTNLAKCGDTPATLDATPLPTTPCWPNLDTLSVPHGTVPQSTAVPLVPMPPVNAPPPTTTPPTTTPPTSTPPAPAPSPLPPKPAGQCASWTATRVVPVASMSGLQSALWAAQPGDRIDMAPGVYVGRLVITDRNGTASSRITLCGPRDAIIDGGSIKSGYAMHLKAVKYWNLVGFTVTDGQKGIILDSSDYNTLSNLLVHSIGMEAVHFRTTSRFNRIEASEIRQTGRFRPEYGEGVYIGSAKSNLVGDNSDFNQVIANRIGPDVTAEGIDIKEYSSSGIVTDNYFDGVGMSGKNYADSWIDVKGNGYYIARNTGNWTLQDGFQTHNVVNGWGSYNVFDANTLGVYNKGFGILTAKHSVNIIRCNNIIKAAASGLSNLPQCSDQPQSLASGEVLPSQANWPAWQTLAAADIVQDTPVAPEVPSDIPVVPIVAPSPDDVVPADDEPETDAGEPAPASEIVPASTTGDALASTAGADQSQLGPKLGEGEIASDSAPLAGSSKNLTIAIAVAVPLVLLLAAAGGFWCYKQRRAKQRTIESSSAGASRDASREASQVGRGYEPPLSPVHVETEGLDAAGPAAAHKRGRSVVRVDVNDIPAEAALRSPLASPSIPVRGGVPNISLPTLSPDVDANPSPSPSPSPSPPPVWSLRERR